MLTQYFELEGPVVHVLQCTTRVPSHHEANNKRHAAHHDVLSSVEDTQENGKIET